MTNEREILRVCSDLQFLRSLFEVIRNEENTYACQMLQGRINAEREAIRLEEDRAVRERAEEMIVVEQKKLITGND